MADNPVFVDSAVSAAKLDRELAAWQQNAGVYARRGWLVLGRDGLDVEIAFLGLLPMAPQPLPIVPACIRVNFDNYDIWAPSVTFIDIFTREPAPPAVRALTWEQGQEQNVLIPGHPETGLPFLCLPGIREYHSHPEHSGDDWLLHRAQRRGSLAAICEQVWQRMVRTVIGHRFEAQGTPVDGGYASSVGAVLLQGDGNAMQEALNQQAKQQQALQAMHQQALQPVEQQPHAQASPPRPASSDAIPPAP